MVFLQCVDTCDTETIIILLLIWLSNFSNHHHHHHQPINVPTAGAQAYLMDYSQGERAITHHAGPVRIGGC
jgi:hypothetical protein